MEKPIGKVLPAKSLILRNAAGSAEGSDGIKYELNYSMAGTPIIRSEKTGKWYVLSWPEILALAEDNGINNH